MCSTACKISFSAGVMASRKCGVWLGTLVLGSLLPAVLVTFGADALIIQRPQNHTVPIGGIATFSCLAQGQIALWKINNTALDDRRAIEFQKRGFVSHRNFSNSIHSLTMTVNALPVNNNTRITCLVYGPADHYTGILIVIGPPPPPDPRLYIFSSTTIQLTWLPPFSSAEYPIVNYTVQVHNRATGDAMNSTINATSTEMFSMTTPVTFIHNMAHRRVMQNCEELVFIVSAANNIGWSSPAVVTGGFPIVPRLDTTSIETMVAFQFDGTPLLFLSIQLPDICPFQELHYSITIQQITDPNNNTLSDAGRAADNIILIGPKTMIGHTSVYEVVNSSLVVDAVYSVLVEFDTLAGNVSSNTTFVVETEDTLTTPSQTSSMACNAQTNFPETITTTIKVTVTPSPTNSPIAGIKLAETIATSVSISLLFIIIAIVIVLVMVCGFIYRKNTPDEKSIEKACKAMVPSPIYEEPQYEIVQPELNTLETPHQTADAVASIDNPFYQPVPTNEGIAIAEASEPSQGSLEGSMPLTGTDLSNKNYIVMHPIGTPGTLV